MRYKKNNGIASLFSVSNAFAMRYNILIGLLGTYSNLYNHPTVLDAPKKKIKLSSKTGAPVGFVGKNRIKEEEESDEEGDYDTVRFVFYYRQLYQLLTITTVP